MFVDGVERKDCLIHIRDDVEYTSADKIFMKGMIMEKSGTIVGQHAHDYGHTSLLTRGRLRVFADGDEVGIEYTAPAFIWIPEKIKHLFSSLEDNTHVYCIHNMTGKETELPSVFAEHTTSGGG